jgi:hypothetical protein
MEQTNEVILDDFLQKVLLLTKELQDKHSMVCTRVDIDFILTKTSFAEKRISLYAHNGEVRYTTDERKLINGPTQES